MEDLTRQERKRLQKKRARVRGIILLACLLLFITGVSITYDVMQKVLGLKNDESIISFRNTGQALNELTCELPRLSDHIKNMLFQIYVQAHWMLERLLRWFAALIRR
ncbi:MAG: hypothetical protein ACOYEH_05075 [Caldicoprobacterales bacterium]|nr:hypothetical protein [Clostridiales bacterium]